MRKFLVLLTVGIAIYIAQEELRELFTLKTSKMNSSEIKETKVDTASRKTASFIPFEIKNTSALEAAEKYFLAHKEQWGLKEYHEFRPVEFKTPLSTKVKYTIYQDGVPILGIGISLEVEKNMTVKEIENNYIPVEKAEIPKQDKKVSEVLSLAGDRFSNVEDPSLIAPAIIVVVPGTKIPQVAYQVSVKDKSKNNEMAEILLRTNDGQVLAKTHPRSEF